MAELVSVVIPTFNQGRYLPAALDSVLDQDYSDLEVIVVNDGSTDETAAILDGYGGRIRVLSQPNHGASRALNEGIKAAHGSLVCWLSSDDRFLPGKITAQVSALSLVPDAAMSWTGYFEVDADGRRIRYVSTDRWLHRDLFVGTFWSNPINGSTVMIRRAALDAVGLFDESLTADVDCDMWLRVLHRYRKGAMIDMPLVEYRIHSGMMSNRAALMRESIRRVRETWLASGELERAVIRSDPDPADRLFQMSMWFGLRGHQRIAKGLLRTSTHLGLGPMRRALGRGALGVSGSHLHLASIDAFKRLRHRARLAGRLRT